MADIDENDVRRALRRSVNSIRPDDLRGPQLPRINPLARRQSRVARWVPAVAAAVAVALAVGVISFTQKHNHLSQVATGPDVLEPTVSQSFDSTGGATGSRPANKLAAFNGPYCGESVNNIPLLSTINLNYELTAGSVVLTSDDPGIPELSQHSFFAVIDKTGQIIAVGPTTRDPSIDGPIIPNKALTISFLTPRHACNSETITQGKYTVVVIVERFSAKNYYRTPAVEVSLGATGWEPS